MSKPSQWVLEISGFPHFIPPFSPDGGLHPGFWRCTTTPNAQPGETVSPGPASLFLPSLCFVLVLDLFSPETPQLSVPALLSLVWPRCELSVSSQCGPASGGGHGAGDAVDQEGGEGKRKEVLSAV